MTKHTDDTAPFDDFVDGYIDGMVTGYVFFATYINEDGDTCYWGETMEGQLAHTSLGMIEAMRVIDQQRVIQHHFGEPNA